MPYSQLAITLGVSNRRKPVLRGRKAAVSIDQGSIDTFNLSAAMHCLQIVYENLGNVLDEKPKDAQLNPQLKNYVEATAQRILSGQLFFE